MSAGTLTQRSSVIAQGESAPDFTLPDQNRKEWKLSDALAKGDVVLSFFPFAFTGVCSTEMKCITAEMQKWEEKGATVVGISCDSFAALKAWADQLGIKHTLLSDLHRDVCKAFGLYWAEMNVAGRGTVVIGKSGKVKWSDARQPGNAVDFDAVLAQLS